MKVTVLGCGSSVGTPAAGGYWGDCDPANPKNERTRASLLVQKNDTDILIDTTYDLRTQLNSVEQTMLDAVLLSHAHSDHINGIDDLRVISYQNGDPLPAYTNQSTMDDLKSRLTYIFDGGGGGIYKPFLTENIIEESGTVDIQGVPVTVFPQDHGTCTSLGFRIDDFAYSVDVKRLSEESLEALEGIDTWIVDAAGYHREHMHTHATFKEMFKWVDRIKPRMTYLTVLTNFMDYKTLCDELPDHIRPAYDGMVLNF